MAFQPSPAQYPERKPTPDDPRFLDLFTTDAKAADLLLCGIPYDGAVIGRKGCRDGPTGIREAFRFLATWHPGTHTGMPLAIHDLGDTPIRETDTLATHKIVEEHLAPVLDAKKPIIVLGGDNSLSFPTFKALHQAYGGSWGVVVIDAHYDLRPYEGQPTSGTPYRRILTEVPGNPVQGANLVEVGIRPYANAPALAKFAKENKVQVIPISAIRRKGMEIIAKEAVAKAGKGVDHLFLSVDIDGLDQSIASGCSAPGAGGLTFEEAALLVETLATDPRCRAMDLVEVAPSLDPTGNTARVAAQLVAHFAAAIASRPR